MSEELRPCPFCNMPAASRTSKIDGKEYYSCLNVDCPNGSWLTAAEWNTRPIEDALEARIAELEAAQARWVMASERLPEIEDGDSKDYDVVLTYPFRRDVIVATWSYDALDKTHRRRWFDCSSDEWGSDDITEYVTHWRERPTPPEVQE